MKILVLSYEYPPIGGGGGVICKNISENLAIMGNQVTVLTTAFKSETDNPEYPGNDNNINNLNVIRLNAKRKKTFESNPFEMLSWITTTERYIKSNPGFIDFDICMAHFVLPGGKVALWLKRDYGLPYVLISHGHEIPWVHPRQMFLFHLAAYYRIKRVCRESALVFVQTQMMKANLDRFMGERQAHKHIIIPNGVDSTHFYPDFSRRSQKLRIIFAGRLVLQKDPMTFLKAIKIFSDHTRDFEVHIIGDGNLRNKLERFVQKNNLTPNVKFIGRISGEQMLEEYQEAHLMVAPSLNEGMSIAAMEAIKSGVYLLASHASGFEEMISENINGEFIALRNPAELSEKMICFYEQNLPKRLLPDTVTASMKIHDWKDISRHYHVVFLTLLR